MDQRERRQRRDEFAVDEVLLLDVPVWYLRLSGRLRRSWQRDVLSLIALGSLCAVVGFVVGRLTASPVARSVSDKHHRGRFCDQLVRTTPSGSLKQIGHHGS